jgi:hypothetical protein
MIKTKIMPLVVDGDASVPFIISRTECDNWFVTYPYPSENSEEWLVSAREQDPLALMFLGADFAKDSFPYVFDKILGARLVAESETWIIVGDDICEFLENIDDNLAALSPEAAEYLTNLDRPLEWIDVIRSPALVQRIEKKVAEAAKDTTPASDDIENEPEDDDEWEP